MTPLPLAVHTADQVRALDRYAVEQLRVPGYALMTRAGEAAVRVLRECWPAARRVVVVCGPGNNGGDGYVLARLARELQIDVYTVALAETDTLEGDARQACDDFVAAGGATHPWDAACLDGADVVVDAIFGVGLSRPVEGKIAQVIRAINACKAARFALDIPSGLDADSGDVLGVAVVADRTLTFVGLKIGFYLGAAPDYTGSICFDDLGLPAEAIASVGIAAQRIDENAIARVLAPRRRTAHKGDHGRVLVIGGGVGMGGAARLVGEAALRVGAGLVTVATRAENVAAILAGRPELMCRGVESRQEIETLIGRTDVIAVGPGLGQDEWAQSMFEAVLAAGKLTVLDADALNLLAKSPQSHQQWIITPHPGEAGRLLQWTTAEIQADRLTAVRALAGRYGGVVVLKGAGTLVVGQDTFVSVCDRGNPGMAAPGMGDVLTGVVAGIAAQTANLDEAARIGVLVHAMAGDLAARRGQRGLLASDLFAHLPTCVNPLPHR
jgi:NAD(P)H-hydrate epimerase